MNQIEFLKWKRRGRKRKFRIYNYYRRFHQLIGKATEPFLNITNILDLDWEVLIILDACRYDYLCEILNKELDYIYSVATDTYSFYLKTFSHDTSFAFPLKIYLASPIIFHPSGRDKFVKLRKRINFINCWDFLWNEEYLTVPHQSILNYVLENEDFSGKVIIHLIQPHAPYYKKPKKSMELWRELSDKAPFITPNNPSAKKLISLYKQTLSEVIDDVMKFSLKIPINKVIITSDHGELFGEFGLYGHLPNMYHITKLVKVPLVKIPENL